ncbi:TPA: 16S rRNA (guanine(527)-N(7))-methyltransferase RsmG, partial [candidate division WOR-3 bacterium]|nr:16S rRNA (guanine(527)-N(7))-methyltransferase RsmG [candidate division WOR-3 bacterium]
MFEEYLNLILKWNKSVSLVSKRDEGALMENHLVDSILGSIEIKDAVSEKITDLGSGNGFPAIPMKIFYEDSKITMIEINQRKASFLKEVVRTLSLKEIRVENIDMADFDFSRTDRIIARAFKPITEIKELLLKKTFS